jgi:peptide methionine sulfoxide reductase msrA/msrB
MRTLIAVFAVFSVASLAGCASRNDATGTAAEAGPAAKAVSKPRKSNVTPDSVAYFAGGCFWGVEHYLEQLDGVASVESGYMGGHVKSPTYEQVSSENTGHLETVRVRFDSKMVSFEEVARRFFEIHDPTQANGQGPDIGSQYLSAVFYTSEAQKKTTEELIALLVKRGYKVVTAVRPAGEFTAAEDYHQDYYARTGKQPYCHTRVRRFDRDAR